jgi:hypothetical protein
MFIGQLLTEFGSDLIDVIKAVPARDNSGTLALSAEIAGYQSIRQPGVDLVAFAKRHFGTGRLRKIGDGLYAVLRGTPATINVPPARQSAPVFPSWTYHV